MHVLESSTLRSEPAVRPDFSVADVVNVEGDPQQMLVKSKALQGHAHSTSAGVLPSEFRVDPMLQVMAYAWT